MAKEFLYLVQSSSGRLPPFRPLAERPSSDAVFLTWDQPADGALYLEKCTWGEGRNRLTEAARGRPGYAYYIFMDDDAVFAKGGYDRFEELLRRHRPATACPVFIPKSLYTVLGVGQGLMRPPFRCLQAQIQKRGDCQMMALHRNVLEDGLLYPVQTRFDRLSWWCTSGTLQILAVNLYGRHSLQINPVAILNAEHRPYTRKAGFPEHAEWLARQFRRPVDLPADYIVNPFSGDGRAKLAKRLRGSLPRKHRLFTEWLRVFAGSLLYRPRAAYGYTPDALARILRPDSDLYRQYLALSPRAAPATPPRP